MGAGLAALCCPLGGGAALRGRPTVSRRDTDADGAAASVAAAGKVLAAPPDSAGARDAPSDTAAAATSRAKDSFRPSHKRRASDADASANGAASPAWPRGTTTSTKASLLSLLPAAGVGGGLGDGATTAVTTCVGSVAKGGAALGADAASALRRGPLRRSLCCELIVRVSATVCSTAIGPEAAPCRRARRPGVEDDAAAAGGATAPGGETKSGRRLPPPPFARGSAPASRVAKTAPDGHAVAATASATARQRIAAPFCRLRTNAAPPGTRRTAVRFTDVSRMLGKNPLA